MHGLLVFREQHLTAEAQLRLAAVFGQVECDNETATGFNYVSNVAEDGVNPAGPLGFHTDHSMYPNLLYGIMLYGIQVPPEGAGGETLFASAKLAYAALPESLKQRIEGLTSRHGYPDLSKSQAFPGILADGPHAERPLALLHPYTADKILFLSRRHVDCILELPRSESDALIETLSAYLGRPEHVYRHVWRPGDVVVWDNIALQHARTDFDPRWPRHLRRMQIGNPLVEPTASKTGSANRSAFIAGTAAAFASMGVVRTPARAAEFQFKFGVDLPVDHWVTKRLGEMLQYIEQQSGGRLAFQFFPASQLGSDSAMLGQTRSGALDFYFTFPAIVEAVVPAAGIGQLGYAFVSEDEGLRVMSGPLGDYVRKEMVTAGIYPLRSMWTTGMYVVTSGVRPILTPDDFRNFKVRVATSKITVDLFKAFGATPTSVAAAEIYVALQTKLVDGTAMGLASLQSFKIPEVQRYVSLTDHTWSGFWIIANTLSWNRLPPDLQALVETVNTKYSLINRADSKQQTQMAVDRLTKVGMMINPVDRKPFVAELGGYYKAWSEAFGPTEWNLLQQGLGRALV